MFDQTPAVFSRADEFQELRAFGTRRHPYLYDSEGGGYDVEDNVYTVEQARDNLLPLLKKNA